MADRACLGYDHQKKQEDEDDHVNCPFGDDGAKRLIEWYFLITGKNAATRNFAQPRKCHICEITYHHCEECILQ